MAGASILRELSDADLEWVHHQIRRDAMTDLEIGTEAEKRLGREISGTEHGKAMVVHRYRSGRHYADWLSDWKRKEESTHARIAGVREKYELLKGAVEGSFEGTFEGISKTILARLLVEANEVDGDQLKAAMSQGGWLKNALGLVQASVHDNYRRKVEDLKAQLSGMSGEDAQSEGLSMDLVVDKVDEIMGLK